MVASGGLVGSSEGAYGGVSGGGGGVQVYRVLLRQAGPSIPVHHHLQSMDTGYDNYQDTQNYLSYDTNINQCQFLKEYTAYVLR